jgi:hypothetical protein
VSACHRLFSVGKYSNKGINYSNLSVYEFLQIRDAQINTCFSIYKPIFAYTSSFLLQTDHCSQHLFSGSNGKLISILQVFALQAVLEEWIKLINWRIPVLALFSSQEELITKYRFCICYDITSKICTITTILRFDTFTLFHTDFVCMFMYICIQNFKCLVPMVH